MCCSGNVIEVEAMFACYGPCCLCFHGGLFVDGVPLEVGVEVAQVGGEGGCGGRGVVFTAVVDDVFNEV